MRAVIARIAAAIVAALLTWAAGMIPGFEVTEDTRAALTEGVTLIGLALWGILYGLTHRLINRQINPADVASPEKAHTALTTGGRVLR